MDKKGAFRTNALLNMKRIASLPQVRMLDSFVNLALIRVLEQLAPKSILFFYPLKGEPDIRKVIAHFRAKRDTRLYLPFMQDVSFKMVALRLPIFRKKFGVKEPSFSYFNHNRVDVVVVPIVGIDRSFRRVGYGKGMYDRFFSNLQNKPTTIFITRSLSISSEIITQKHDVKANIIIDSDNALIKGIKDDRVDYIKLARLGSSRWRRYVCGVQKGKQR